MILRKMGVMAVGDNFSGLRIDYRIFVYGCSRWEVMVQGSRAWRWHYEREFQPWRSWIEGRWGRIQSLILRASVAMWGWGELRSQRSSWRVVFSWVISFGACPNSRSWLMWTYYPDVGWDGYLLRSLFCERERVFLGDWRDYRCSYMKVHFSIACFTKSNKIILNSVQDLFNLLHTRKRREIELPGRKY